MLGEMTVRSLFLRHRALRWTVPVGVAGVVMVAATGVLSAQSIPPLPTRTAAQLLADVETAQVDGLSGTVVAKASLGIPALPDAASGTSLISLLSGSHTLRVWYAGDDRQRVALMDATGEADVFHNGRDIWTYDSSTHQATHTRLPAASATSHQGQQPPAGMPTLTPQQVAAQVLAAVDPTTAVSVGVAHQVAGRAAYELVLTPRGQTSRIGSVRIAIDGKTSIPLRVRVYPRGLDSPAVDVAYTRISYGVPNLSNFTFTPATSVHVRQMPSAPAGAPAQQPKITTIGSGWTTVVRAQGMDLLGAGSGGASSPSAGSGELSGYLQTLPRVSWSGGSGRLLQTTLLTVLISDDGRLYAGPVDRNVLLADAAAHK